MIYKLIIDTFMDQLWIWYSTGALNWERERERDSSFTLSFDPILFNVVSIRQSHYRFARNILHDNRLQFVQSGGWICTVSVKTGHCALSSRDLNEWLVASMHSALAVLLCPAQLCMKIVSSWCWTLGKMDLGRDGSHSKWLFNHRFGIQCFCMYVCHFTLHFSSYIRTSLVWNAVWYDNMNALREKETLGKFKRYLIIDEKKLTP